MADTAAPYVAETAGAGNERESTASADSVRAIRSASMATLGSAHCICADLHCNVGAMPRRQRILSAFFVGFVALKLTEGFLRLESWPLTHIPMFSGYIPANVIPHRIVLQGNRGGPWFDLDPSYFDLTRDEFVRLLYFDFDNLASNCGELGRIANARQPLPAQRLRALRANIEPVPRPSSIRAPAPKTVPCALGPSG